MVTVRATVRKHSGGKNVVGKITSKGLVPLIGKEVKANVQEVKK